MKLTVLSCLLTFIAAEHTSISTDFEEGSMSPWNTSGNSWNIQSFHLSSFAKPPSGDKYLVAGRNLEVDSGTADLQSPMFTALPGHFFQFSCWVQVNFIHFNSLFKSADFTPRRDGRHSLILESQSTTLSSDWRAVSIHLPVKVPTNVSVCKLNLLKFN